MHYILKNFKSDLSLKNTGHNSIQDFKNHLVNWSNIKKKNNDLKPKSASTKINYY